MNLYAKTYKRYKDKGLVVLPDRYGSKAALLKGWQTFFNDKPTAEQYQEWVQLPKANISLLLGKASGIVALDIDTDKPEIMEVIEHLLPKSPVTKRGAKGYTAFFRYKGEHTEVLRFNGEVILEILSEGKKTTLPPSQHPNGAEYVWEGKALEDIKIEDLPVLPPALVAHLSQELNGKIGETPSYGRTVNGRNSLLSSEMGKLLKDDSNSMESIIKTLIKYDQESHTPPYFTDANEFQCTDAVTNATLFYAQHLQSYNSKRYRDSKEYIKPRIQTGDMGKQQGSLVKVQPKLPRECPSEYLPANSVIRTTYETILKNSHIPQPQLALGATLALFSVLTARKFQFRGMSSNLYICNISPSGTGKDAPQQLVKQYLGECRGDNLLGAGDYVSDASLMDNLPHKPTRLDIIDEVGGLLRAVTRGGDSYATKMADILTELYTTSSGYFMGRALANSFKDELTIKGQCYRPNVCLLGSTTPTGFADGVSRKSLEKGLLGRFLIFRGSPTATAQEVHKPTPLPESSLRHLSFLSSYKPPQSDISIKGVQQHVKELAVSPAASMGLTEAFQEFEAMRLKAVKTKYAPIVSRAYQLMLKFCIISALSRVSGQVSAIAVEDVQFAYKLTKYYMDTMTNSIGNLIYDSKREQAKLNLMSMLKEAGRMTIKDLTKKTPHLSPNYRKEILDELELCDILTISVEKDYKGKLFNTYHYKGDNNE